MPDLRAVFTAALLFFAAALIVLGGAYLLVRLRTILIWLVLAGILATGLTPLVDRLAGARAGRNRLRRSTAAALVFIGIVAVAALVLTVVAGPAGRQVALLMQETNEYLYQIKVQWEAIQRKADWLPNLSPTIDRLLAHARNYARPGPELMQVGLGVLSSLGATLTVLLMTLYILIQPPSATRLVGWVVPPDRRPRLAAAFAVVRRRFQAWLRAQVILSATVGLLTFLGLLLLGIPYAHLLALTAAFGELIPIAGPILAAVPAVAVAMFRSPEQLVGVVILAVAIQAVENYILVPQIMRAVVGVPPLVTIMVLMVGFELFGLVGAILAVPVAAALGILIPEIAGALTSTTPLSEEPEEWPSRSPSREVGADASVPSTATGPAR